MKHFSLKVLTIAVCLNICFFKFIVKFSASQCFTRIVPKIPNHGLNSITIVETITNEELQEQIRKGHPIVVTKQMENWTATKRWKNLEYFKHACPDVNVGPGSFREYIDDLLTLENYLQVRNKDRKEETKQLLVEDMYFSHNEELFYQCPKLWDDVQNFSLARHRASKPTSWLGFITRSLISNFETSYLTSEFVWGDWVQAVTWIGPPGSVTKLHYDDDPMSILYQFKGEKRIRIWSPDQSKYLYPEKDCVDNSEYGTRFSKIEENLDDLEYINKFFPKFQNATALEHILKPGEMIYIPSGWWHHVEVLSMSVSVAARSYTECEGLSYIPNFIINFLHQKNIIDGEGFCITPPYLYEHL
eukprot:g9435.t1